MVILTYIYIYIQKYIHKAVPQGGTQVYIFIIWGGSGRRPLPPTYRSERVSGHQCPPHHRRPSVAGVSAFGDLNGCQRRALVRPSIERSSGLVSVLAGEQVGNLPPARLVTFDKLRQAA